MIKGTTPTHIFTLPFDTSIIEAVRILYSQNDKIVLIKESSDCSLENNTIITTLTQENTFAFDHLNPIEIQIRILTKEGRAMASIPKKVGVTKCLENEVFV